MEPIVNTLPDMPAGKAHTAMGVEFENIYTKHYAKDKTNVDAKIKAEGMILLDNSIFSNEVFENIKSTAEYEKNKPTDPIQLAAYEKLWNEIKQYTEKSAIIADEIAVKNTPNEGATKKNPTARDGKIDFDKKLYAATGDILAATGLTDFRLETVMAWGVKQNDLNTKSQTLEKTSNSTHMTNYDVVYEKYKKLNVNATDVELKNLTNAYFKKHPEKSPKHIYVDKNGNNIKKPVEEMQQQNKDLKLYYDPNQYIGNAQQLNAFSDVLQPTVPLPKLPGIKETAVNPNATLKDEKKHAGDKPKQDNKIKLGDKPEAPDADAPPEKGPPPRLQDIDKSHSRYNEALKYWSTYTPPQTPAEPPKTDIKKEPEKAAPKAKTKTKKN